MSTIEKFKKFFSFRSTNVERLAARLADVRSDLIDVYLALDDWKKDESDPRWQIFEPRYQRRQGDVEHWRARGQADPGDAWVALGDVQTAVKALLAEINAERSSASSSYVVDRILEYNLLESSGRKSWIQADLLQIDIDAVIPKDMYTVISKEEVWRAAGEAAAPFRRTALAKVQEMDQAAADLFDSRKHPSPPTREETRALNAQIQRLNLELQALAGEAYSAATAAAARLVDELNQQREARTTWTITFVKKLVTGFVSLGAAIARLVASMGADAFAWYSGAKSVVKIAAELYAAWLDAAEVQRALAAKIQTLESRLDAAHVKIKAQRSQTGKEVLATLLSAAGLPPMLVGQVMVTVGDTANTLVLFRSKLQGVRQKSDALVAVLEQALADAEALKGSGEIDAAKADKLAKAVTRTIEAVQALYEPLQGANAFAQKADKVLYDYTRAFDGLYKTSADTRLGVSDLLNVFTVVSGVDTMLGAPLQTAATDALQPAIDELMDAAGSLA